MAEPAAQNPRVRKHASVLQEVVLAIYLIVLGAFLLITAFGVWPTSTAASRPVDGDAGGQEQIQNLEELGSSLTEEQQAKLTTAIEGLKSQLGSGEESVGHAIDVGYPLLGTLTLELTWEQHLLLIVILLGAIGSWLHAASSFVVFVGSRKFITSWILWYLIRPLIGSAMAVLFYLVLRGGLLTADTGGESLSVYGIAAVAGLVGLFTHSATKKLREVFDTIFRTQEETPDQLGVSANIELTATPKTAPVGAASQVVELAGDGLTSATTVEVNGEERSAVFTDDKKLQVTLEEAELSQPGTIKITTANPAGEVAVEVKQAEAS